MLRPLLLVCAIGLFAASSAREVKACMSFDRAAEMRLIDAAIASPKTAAATRTELEELRKVILVGGGNVAADYRATTKALKLIGKSRIRNPSSGLTRC